MQCSRYSMPAMKVSDKELLKAWQDGDLDAGEELFERYYEAVVRFFGNKLQDGVADLVQQTFMACVEGRDRLRKMSSFRSYLFAIAHNKFRAHLRSRYRGDDEPNFEALSVMDIAPGPGSIFARRREERLLLEALRAIPVDYQVLVELRYWEGLKTIEIAEIVALPHGTVRSRLRRAQKLLEQAIEELSNSRRQFDSTIHGLDDWARRCREQIIARNVVGTTASDD